MISFHVYILFSKRINKFYVGSTNNLNKRILQHNNKEPTYTSAGVPWLLLWSTSKDTRLEAEQLEHKLKNLSRERKIRFMRKYAAGVFDEKLLTLVESL